MGSIETAFGGPANVEASITSEGKIQIVDKVGGESLLSVNLTSNLNNINAGTLDFGTFSSANALHRYVLQEGKDASLTIDGMDITSSSNTISNAIPGLTLNLAGEDSGTTVTVDVGQDKEGIEEKVQSFIDAYNETMDFINTQTTYNADTNKTGGPLFGDSLLKSIKSGLQSTLVNQVWGATDLVNLRSIGITTESDNKLSLDSSIFQEKLDKDFEGVARLFSAYGTSSNNSLQYYYSSRDTQEGDYSVNISQTASKAAFAGSGINWLGGYTGSDGDTLTLTDSVSGKSFTKTFSNGEGLWDIVNELNSQFDNEGISINASINNDNQLVISREDYGSGKGFSLSYTGGSKASLGITDPDDTADGRDVAGTINGIAATGTGQLLKAVSGAANGLQIRYTGSATGDVGTLGFGKGVASKLESQIYRWTDFVDGSISRQEKQTESSISRLEDRITTTEDRIDRRMERYMRQFQALESALAEMQSTQSWLGTQLASMLG